MEQTPDQEVVEAVERVLNQYPDDVEAYRNGEQMRSMLFLGMAVDNELENRDDHHPEVVSDELERQLNQEQ